jgi:hypothetical protein
MASGKVPPGPARGGTAVPTPQPAAAARGLTTRFGLAATYPDAVS